MNKFLFSEDKNYNENKEKDFNEIDEKYLDESDKADLSFNIKNIKPLHKNAFETLDESKEVRLGDLKVGDTFIDPTYDNQKCKVLGSLADDDRIDFEVLDGEDKGLRFSKGKAAIVLIEDLKK